MKARDRFKISEGNMTVLRLIPEMMSIPAYRKELRDLTIKYIFEKGKSKK